MVNRCSQNASNAIYLSMLPCRCNLCHFLPALCLHSNWPTISGTRCQGSVASCSPSCWLWTRRPRNTGDTDLMTRPAKQSSCCSQYPSLLTARAFTLDLVHEKWALCKTPSEKCAPPSLAHGREFGGRRLPFIYCTLSVVAGWCSSSLWTLRKGSRVQGTRWTPWSCPVEQKSTESFMSVSPLNWSRWYTLHTLHLTVCVPVVPTY